MKVYLTVKGDNITGYHNIDASSGGDIVGMSGVEDSEATEIIASDVINFTALSSLNDLLSSWVKKLRHGGRIVLGGVEIDEVCKAFITKAIDIKQFNDLVHEGRISQISSDGLDKMLTEHGLTITKKRTDNFNMIVEAMRP
jgi:hypothetical protein